MPSQSEVQAHVFGAEQVPPFWHIGEHIAVTSKTTTNGQNEKKKVKAGVK